MGDLLLYRIQLIMHQKMENNAQILQQTRGIKMVTSIWITISAAKNKNLKSHYNQLAPNCKQQKHPFHGREDGMNKY